ncbi:MAG TPA: hypothetical protein VHE54_12375 [Puia sp.]|nr:hypothetical protein [Puia sp.]
MKKIPLRLALLPAIIIALVAPACKKAIEYWEEHNPAAAYRIDKITYLDVYGVPDSIAFTYNAWGDPVSGIRTRTSTGYTNFLFQYDQLHRLTDKINIYGVDLSYWIPPESWDRFFYDDKGRIAVDSQYFFPDIVNGRPVQGKYGVVTLFYFEYDAFDRITRVSMATGGKIFYVNTYSYDSGGNLAGQPHDAMINFRRCNRIWMFLSRDYSLNNPLNAVYTYNRTGLPLTIDCTGENSQELIQETMGTLTFSHATIAYSRARP